MIWIPFIVAAGVFLALFFGWLRVSKRAHTAREHLQIRILVVGSRGKSGTVRLIHSIISGAGIPTYAKVTGTVAEEIDIQGNVSETLRIGPISANEMLDVLIKADRNGAQAAVMECMAVAPKLIAFVQQKVVQAPIVVIPTIRLDHLEDEGNTLKSIAHSIVDGMQPASHIITGETNEEVLAVFRNWCRHNDAEFTHVQADPANPDIPGHHPTNVAAALAVASILGIDRKDAISYFAGVTVEPDAETSWNIHSHGVDITLSDVGGANDPQSGAEAAARAVHDVNGDGFVPILVNRWDRPLRSLAFASALKADPRITKVGIIGTAFPQATAILRRNGFRKDQIVRLSWFNTLPGSRALHTLSKLVAPRSRAQVVMFENIHAFPADQIRNAAHNKGTAIFEGSALEEGGTHD